MSRFIPCTQEASVCQICNDRKRTCIELYQQHMKFIELHQLHVYGPLLSRRLQEATRMPLDFQKDMISVWNSTCCCFYFNFSLQRYAYIYIYIPIYTYIYIYIERVCCCPCLHSTPDSCEQQPRVKKIYWSDWWLNSLFPNMFTLLFSFFC